MEMHRTELCGVTTFSFLGISNESYLRVTLPRGLGGLEGFTVLMRRYDLPGM